MPLKTITNKTEYFGHSLNVFKIFTILHTGLFDVANTITFNYFSE